MTADGGIRFGNYLLLRRLARGGMAEVFLAQQRGLEGFDRRVAVKRILPHLVDSPDFVRMFLGEAKLAAQLTHPNIVHIYDFGKVDHDYFIAMEYIEGVHAGQLFQESAQDRAPPHLVARIGADTAAALHYAHELRGPGGQPLGLVHRDVSPANLMISYDGVVKLCDFGIAKAVSLTDQRTNPGQVKGKYAYMSPEQTVAAPLDGRSDVFALSIVLWELLAGKTIVARGDAIAAMRAIRDGKLQPLAQAAPHVPAPLADAIGWGLATRREDRATAAELATALEAFLKASPELATPMQVGAWVRSRFSREAPSGPQAALGPDAGPRTAVATAAGEPERAGRSTIQAEGTGIGDAPARDRTAAGAPIAGLIPVTPVSTRADPDELAETIAVTPDPDLGVETLIVEDRARPIANRLTARQLAPSAAAPERASPSVLNPAALAGAAPRISPAALHATALANAAPRAQPLDETIHEPRAAAAAAVAPRGPQPFAPVPGSQPWAVDPRGYAAAASAGNAGPFARAPRRLVLVGGLVAIAVGSFLLALAVCSPQRQAAAPDATPGSVAQASPDADVAAPARPGALAATTAPDALPRPGRYQIDTRPPGGTVQIGDRRLAAPASFELPPGRHTVTVELDGWQPETRTIELAAGADLVEEVELTRRIHIVRAPQTGTLTVRTSPPSDVYIGTRKLGQAPLTDLEVPAGTYWLTFKHPRHATLRRQITVTTGKLTRLPPVTLPPL